MSDENKLKELRRRIDAVDQQLLALLRERADIVEEVRGAKGKQNIYIRPGREASMLRALCTAPQGHIPKGLVHRLWREMIGAFTLQEGTMCVATYALPGQEGFWDTARDHFGSFTPMKPYASGHDMIRAVQAGQCQIAALPFPEEEGECWWRLLLSSDPATPNVFYAFPFDGLRGNARDGAGAGLALGCLAPEATGDDRTVLVIEWQPTATRDDVNRAVAALGGLLDRHVVSAAGQEPLCSWLECKGFNAVDGIDFKEWVQQRAGLILRHKGAGCYPSPFKS